MQGQVCADLWVCPHLKLCADRAQHQNGIGRMQLLLQPPSQRAVPPGHMLQQLLLLLLLSRAAAAWLLLAQSACPS
jgi:hypothetical protein